MFLEINEAITRISDILQEPGETQAEYLRRQAEEYLMYPGETARPRGVYRLDPDDHTPEF